MTPHMNGTDCLLFDSRGDRWLRFGAPRTTHAARRVEDVVPALEAVQADVTQGGFWAAGFLSYEAAPAFDTAYVVKKPAGLPLLWFGIFDPPATVSPADLPTPAQAPPLDWKPTVGRGDYGGAIDQIKRHIEAGDTYQVNYTLRLRAAFDRSALHLFLELMAAQRAARYGAFIGTHEWAVCSASPEMFFEWDGRTLISRPMKGTAPRGPSLPGDLEIAAELHRSEKNRAENVMIVDMVRNDLGRIADVGSVEVPSLFEVERYPTLWQMTSDVRCTTRAGIVDIFGALFPAASITGAPKARTMQIIAELETTPRSVYTGTIGFISPEPRAQFNVAIRTVLVDSTEGSAEYGVGGGIVWDSTEGGEFEECLTKARILTRRTPDFSLLESLLWTPEAGYPLLEAHLERMARAAEYFQFDFDGDDARRLLTGACTGLPPVPHKARILASRHASCSVDMQLIPPLPAPYLLGLARTPVDPSDPFIHHKTTRREVYQRAMNSRPDCNDVLLWNNRGEITETCIANALFHIDGKWVTPPASCGLLPGIGRALLIQRGEVCERMVTVDDLPRATQIRLVNSVRGCWDVTMGTEKTAPMSHKIGRAS